MTVCVTLRNMYPAKCIGISIVRSFFVNNFILVFLEFQSPSQESGTQILDTKYPGEGAVICYYSKRSARGTA